MATFQEKLIETIEKDLTQVQELENDKIKRKELSLIQKRIESTQKLIGDDSSVQAQLDKLSAQILKLKNR